jgi:hypothetical protein
LATPPQSWSKVFDRQGTYDLHSFDADADDLADEADDVLFVVGVVGVAGDAAALVGADLIPIDDNRARCAGQLVL